MLSGGKGLSTLLAKLVREAAAGVQLKATRGLIHTDDTVAFAEAVKEAIESQGKVYGDGRV